MGKLTLEGSKKVAGASKTSGFDFLNGLDPGGVAGKEVSVVRSL